MDSIQNSSENVNNETNNFNKVKRIINYLARHDIKITNVEYKFIFYLLDQQYGYLRYGRPKTGDYVGYGRIAKDLNISRTSAVNAVDRLTKTGIIIKSDGNIYGNHYAFNELLEINYKEDCSE